MVNNFWRKLAYSTFILFAGIQRRMRGCHQGCMRWQRRWLLYVC